MKMYKVSLAITVVVMLGMLLVGGYHYGERVHANPTAVATVEDGMSHSNVVALLGVMYDDAKPGQYKDADRVITRMTNNESISYICSWRIGHSGDMFHVGFNNADFVTATLLETR